MGEADENANELVQADENAKERVEAAENVKEMVEASPPDGETEVGDGAATIPLHQDVLGLDVSGDTGMK